MLHCLSRMWHLLARSIKYWNRLSLLLEPPLSYVSSNANLKRRDIAICWSTIISHSSITSPPTPKCANPFYGIPNYSIPTPNTMPLINVLTLKFFCFVLICLSVVIRNPLWPTLTLCNTNIIVDILSSKRPVIASCVLEHRQIHKLNCVVTWSASNGHAF